MSFAAYRNIASPMLALAILQVGAGALNTLVPLGLEHVGANAFQTGLVASCFGFGFGLGALFTPRFLGQLGHIRLFAAAAGLGSALCLMLFINISPLSWGPIRFLMGACIAVLFTAGESWISADTPSAKRGTVFGLYHVITKIGLATGPFLIVGLAYDAPQGFMIAAAALALTIPPICATSGTVPAPPSTERFSVLALWQVAPAAVIGAVVSGFFNNPTSLLLPLFAQGAATERGLDNPMHLVASLTSAVWIGGALSQWPAGLISDRMDRRIVITLLGLCSLLASVGLMLVGADVPVWALIGLAGLWGAGSFSFYGLCVAHGVDRAGAERSAQVLSGLLVVWSVATIIGPPIGGFVVDIFGFRALFGFSAVGAVLLVFGMVWRRLLKLAPARWEKGRFVATQPNSKTSIGPVDPEG